MRSGSKPRRYSCANVAAIALVWMAQSVAADDGALALICQGSAPDWSLRLSGAEALFDWPAPLNYDIPQMSEAEGREWPKAFTLIEREERATAILLVDQAACGTAPFRAHVLTQRGTEPVLLTGCCAPG